MGLGPILEINSVNIKDVKMTYKIKMTAVRLDESFPFFYDAPEHQVQMKTVDSVIAELQAIPNTLFLYSKEYSSDRLTCTISVEVKDLEFWKLYMAIISEKLPNGIVDRHWYMLSNNQTLTFAWNDGKGDEGIRILVP